MAAKVLGKSVASAGIPPIVMKNPNSEQSIRTSSSPRGRGLWAAPAGGDERDPKGLLRPDREPNDGIRTSQMRLQNRRHPGIRGDRQAEKEQTPTPGRRRAFGEWGFWARFRQSAAGRRDK